LSAARLFSTAPTWLKMSQTSPPSVVAVEFSAVPLHVSPPGAAQDSAA
jgi:hypothetical protein